MLKAPLIVFTKSLENQFTGYPASKVLSYFFSARHGHRIKISNRRATQRCNVSAFFYAKICSLLARRRSSQPVQRVYWPENVIDWLGKWRPTCVMRHARGQKLQSFRRKWPFYMDLYSMARRSERDSAKLVYILCGADNPKAWIIMRNFRFYTGFITGFDLNRKLLITSSSGK